MTVLSLATVFRASLIGSASRPPSLSVAASSRLRDSSGRQGRAASWTSTHSCSSQPVRPLLTLAARVSPPAGRISMRVVSRFSIASFAVFSSSGRTMMIIRCTWSLRRKGRVAWERTGSPARLANCLLPP